MIVLTDLDGTLARARWRADIRPDWHAYWEASKDDKPNQIMTELIAQLGQSHQVICITSRPEVWRQLTVQWLLKHRVLVDELYMRPEQDYSKSPELKLKLVTPLNLDPKTVLAIDDRRDVIEMYQSLGFMTLLAQET